MFSNKLISIFQKCKDSKEFLRTDFSELRKFYAINNYNFAEVYREIEETRVRVTYVVEPTSEEHRYFYCHFIFDDYSGYKKHYFEHLSYPNTDKNNYSLHLKQKIFNKYKDAVYVPPITINTRKNTEGLDQIVVDLNGSKKIYNSKTQMLKLVTPQLARLISTSLEWDFNEKCALARNILKQNRSFTHYSLYIGRYLLERIDKFLYSFSFSSLTEREIMAVFDHYFKVDKQYLLFKL